MVPGLTVRMLREEDGWHWYLYDAQMRLIGASLLVFPQKVDCFLNYAAHCAMPDAVFDEITDAE